MNPKRQSILQTFMAVLSTQFVGRIVRFLYLVIIARFLVPDDVGIFSYGIALYLFLAGFAQFGQGTLLATRIGRRRHRFDNIVAHSLTIMLVAQSLTAILALAFLTLSEPDPRNFLALCFFVLALIGRGFAEWVRRCFIALEQAAWIPRYELTFRGGEAIVGTALLFLGGGLLTICALHAVFWGVEAMASFVLLARQAGFPIRFGVNWKTLRRFASISTMFMLNASLIGAYAQVGIVGLRLLQPEEATVAFFAVGMQFLTTLLIIPTSLAAAILPGLSRAHRDRSAADLAAVATAVKLCLVAGIAAAIVVEVFGQWVVVLLFGKPYAPAGEAFAWLCWGLGPYAAAFIATQSLNGLNERLLAILTGLVMVAVHVGVMAALVPVVGGQAGASVGLLISAALGAAMSAAALGPRLGMIGQGWWLKPLAVTIVVGALMYGLPVPKWVAGGMGLAIAFGLLWRLRVFDRAERADIVRRGGVVRLLEQFGLARFLR